MIPAVSICEMSMLERSLIFSSFRHYHVFNVNVYSFSKIEILQIRMSIVIKSCLTLILMHYLVGMVFSSMGDRDQTFVNCVAKCKLSCDESEKPLLSWGCKGDCEYTCMFKISNQRRKDGQEVYQYFGKWPFYRLFGFIQEPASFLFSLMNLLSQIFGWLHYSKYVSPKYKFYNLNKLQFLINSFAWLSAAVFHTRDTYWTEKMDYFSAALVIAISLFTCLAEIIDNLSSVKTWISGIVIISLFGFHIFYMAFVHFDYGYNMKFLVLNGIVNILMWFIWCWTEQKKKPFIWKCVYAMGGTLLLAIFEVWDFPPIWWTFDSHSLWHLGTTPVAYIWFSFLTDNALYKSQEKPSEKIY